MKVFYSIMVLFSIMISPVWAAGLDSGKRSFVLAEGSYQTEGVPGFGPNRIAALFGRYESRGEESVSVWAVNEPLVFDPALWEKKVYGDFSPVYARMVEGSRILAIPRSVLMQDRLKDYGRWCFVFRFDARRDETYCKAFLGVFIVRVERFFSAARLLSDLSFPATLEVAGTIKKN